jgi:excisionase family DNA binding protein
MDLIGTAEAATILGLDRSTLVRMVASGDVTAVTLTSGRTAPLFFHRSDIEALRDTRKASK